MSDEIKNLANTMDRADVCIAHATALEEERYDDAELWQDVLDEMDGLNGPSPTDPVSTLALLGLDNDVMEVVETIPAPKKLKAPMVSFEVTTIDGRGVYRSRKMRAETSNIAHAKAKKACKDGDRVWSVVHWEDRANA